VLGEDRGCQARGSECRRWAGEVQQALSPEQSPSAPPCPGLTSRALPAHLCHRPFLQPVQQPVSAAARLREVAEVRAQTWRQAAGAEVVRSAATGASGAAASRQEAPTPAKCVDAAARGVAAIAPMMARRRLRRQHREVARMPGLLSAQRNRWSCCRASCSRTEAQAP